MRKRPIVVAATLVIVGGIAVSFGRFSGERASVQADVAPTAVPVVAGTVVSHDVLIYARGIGTVIAYNSVVRRAVFIAASLRYFGRNSSV